MMDPNLQKQSTQHTEPDQDLSKPQQSPILRGIRKTLPAAGFLAMTIGILIERWPYFSEVRALGHRIPYSDQLLVAFGLLTVIVAALLAWLPALSRRASAIRSRLGRLRWIAVLLAAFAPAWLFAFSDYSLRFTGFWTRLLIYAAAATLAIFFASKNTEKLFEWGPALAGLLVFGGVFMLVNACRDVVDYPFRLSWSEGNRYYDYSVLFGSRLYNYPPGKELTAFIDYGRQFLWGLPFLFTDISIGFMRLWNEFLFTVPYFFLGFFLLRRRDTAPGIPLLFGLWTMLLLNNGPIYTPLILACILVVVTRRSPLWLAIPLVFAASFLAHYSRFTWMFAPGMWAVLLAFLDHRSNAKTRWLRSILLGVSGILGGYVLSDSVYILLRGVSTAPAGVELSAVSDVVGSQTLLWDRLFPTGTFALGVLPALILLSTPALILIIHALASRKWKLDIWQTLYLSAALIAFLVVGIIVSVKIGGGSNLHNLDMFLITLVLAAGLMLETIGKDGLLKPAQLPRWQQMILLVAVVYPATLNMFSTQKLALPDETLVQDGLQTTRTMVNEYQAKGEVLFMDQRQLLTFGYVDKTPLISEYEKKLVMENAITNNQAYFEPFYQDLINQRFSLIVSEPLYTGMQMDKEQFGSENNAWVKWVSVPMLCYYTPAETFNELGLQLLVPRQTIPRQVSDLVACPVGE
jgi:hypothetical protein